MVDAIIACRAADARRDHTGMAETPKVMIRTRRRRSSALQMQAVYMEALGRDEMIFALGRGHRQDVPGRRPGGAALIGGSPPPGPVLSSPAVERRADGFLPGDMKEKVIPISAALDRSTIKLPDEQVSGGSPRAR